MPTNLELAKDPSTSAEILVEILGDIYQFTGCEDDYQERCCAARHPNLPIDTLEDIAAHGSMHFQCMVTLNPSITQVAFDLLSQYEDYWPSLVNNPNVPPHFLVRVARDKRSVPGIEQARWNVASSRLTPPSVLVELSKDSNVGVRVRLASRASISRWLGWRLAADPEPIVRATMAECEGLPESLMVRFYEDEHVMVQKRLMKNKWLTPLDKMWLTAYKNSGMSLQQFLETANAD